MTTPYEPNWNKLLCCSVNNTWHVCPYQRPWLWLGENPQHGRQSQTYPKACLPAFCSLPGLSLVGNLATMLAGKKDQPRTALHHCVGAYDFGKKQTFFIFSQKARERAADRLYGARVFSEEPAKSAVSCWAVFVLKDALSAPLDAGHPFGHHRACFTWLALL